MKKLFTLILPLVFALTSCEKINYNVDLDSHKDNIVVVEDYVNGTIYVNDEGQYDIGGDLYSQTYSVNLKNLSLYPGAPLASVKVSNLMQYYMEKGESAEEKEIPLYFFFRQDPSARLSGDLDISSMKFAYLTNTFWLSFKSGGQFNVWSTPRVRNLYAVENTILSPVSAGYQKESAIQPEYKFTVNLANKTVTIKATGVKFPQDKQDVSQTLNFSTMEWRDIPIEFSGSGYSFFVEELIPYIGGNPAPEHKIGNLQGQIAFDYEGTKTVSYKMLNQYNQNIFIDTKFALLRQSNQ